jgi:hypothetical protein
LPDDVLKNISTFGLIRSILDIPSLYFYFMLSSNSSPIGTGYSIFSHYNAVVELGNRENSGDALLAYYQSVCYDCLKTMDDSEQLEFSIQLMALEVLFTKSEILKQFDLGKKQKLVSLILEKYQQKQYGGTLEVMIWIMYDDGYPPIVKYFESTGLNKEWAFIFQINDIIAIAESFIQQK